MVKFKLHYWPIVTCGWFMLTFVTTYLIAVLNDHVYPLFPYISDTGTIPPESCVFGQMMNIGALLMGITLYIRYRQVGFAINSNDINLRRRWHYMTFWCVIAISLGISVVGNFQESNVLSVHLVGAFLAFFGGAIYLILQTRISFSFRHGNYKYPEYGVGRAVLCLRVFLAVCNGIFILAVVVCAAMSLNRFTGDDNMWWTSEHGGFGLRLASTFSEWLLGITLMLYVLTFTKELKSIEFEEIKFNNKCINTNHRPAI